MLLGAATSATNFQNEMNSVRVNNINNMDDVGRYLQDKNRDSHNIGMNSRALLLICTALCFVVFFYCCLRLVITVTYESIDPGATESGSDAMRETILSNLSVFQRRAILEVFFNNEIFSCSKARKSPSPSHTSSNSGRKKIPLGTNDDDKDDTHDDNDNDRCNIMSPGFPEGLYLPAHDSSGVQLLGNTPLKAQKKNIADEEDPKLQQCFGTPSTQETSCSERDDEPFVFNHVDSKPPHSVEVPKTTTTATTATLTEFPLRKSRLDSALSHVALHGGAPMSMCVGQYSRLEEEEEETRLHFPIASSKLPSPTVLFEALLPRNEELQQQQLQHHQQDEGKNGKTIMPEDSCDMDHHSNDAASACDDVSQEMEVFDDGNICSICLDDYDEGDTIVKSKYCTHYFHRECITQWLEREKSDYKCPCCRNHMVTTDELREAASRIGSDIANTSHEINSTNTHPSPSASSNRRDASRSHFGLGRIMTEYRNSLSAPSSPRRRTYSDESPIFVPDV